MMNSHNQLICPYCNKACIKIKYEAGSEISKMYKLPFPKRRLQFQCKLCNTGTITRLDGRIVSTSYSYTVNPGKHYKATVHWTKKYTEITSIDWVEKSQYYLHNIAYQVNYNIPFTPQNIKSKLATILTFL